MIPVLTSTDRQGSRSASSTTTRASADLLIDSDRLSELVGAQARVTRLRFKPGLSTTAVLLLRHAEHRPHWVQVSHDAHLDKLRKALNRAEQRGQRVHLIRTGELTVAHGPIDTDPRLQKGLDGLREACPSLSAAAGRGEVRVLRYNPQRRLVLRLERPGFDPLVIRVTAGHQVGAVGGPACYAAAGVPVIEPDSGHPWSRNKRITVWPWFGQGDLAHLPGDLQAARAAGQALARLHQADLVSAGVPDPVLSLGRLGADLEYLDVAAARRGERLAGRVAEQLAALTWAQGPVHGDFSADQVLVGRQGEAPVRLTDFDRAGHGALAADLGSFAAVELLAHGAAPGSGHPGALESLPQTRALLAGYAADCGTAASAVTGTGLRAWTARALLARITEPFRLADPDWVARIHQRLDQVEGVLS